MAKTTRVAYARGLITRWSGLLAIIYGGMGAYDLVVGQFWEAGPRIGDVLGGYDVEWYVVGALALVISLTIEGGYRQHSVLEAVVEAHADTDPVERSIRFLSTHDYRLGEVPVAGNQAFVDLAPLFRQQITQEALREHIRDGFPKTIQGQKVPEATANTWSALVTTQIIRDWSDEELLENWVHDPAPGAPSSIRQSIHDLPSTVYRLNSHGLAVIRNLKARSGPPSVTRALDGSQASRSTTTRPTPVYN